MTDEEREKMWKEISKIMDDQAKQLQRMSMLYGQWTSSITQPNVSPTAVESRGMFPYQEPEQDEQGTYYGYKVLVMCHCGCGELHSPRYPVVWRDGELHADQEPSENTMFGIHCTKRMDNPALNDYTKSSLSVLVKCALSGTVVETEQGFRAEHALIVGVYNGNWESYQDYKERATTNSHRNPWDEENWWNANYDPRTTFTWNTNPTPKKGKGGKFLP